jgi:anti-anti-sigma factor
MGIGSGRPLAARSLGFGAENGQHIVRLRPGLIQKIRVMRQPLNGYNAGWVHMAMDFVQTAVVQSVNVIDLKLPEQLDSEEFDHLNDSLLKVLDGKISSRWLLDLSAVDYMGSSVLGLMINIRQHVKSGGGTLALCGLTPRMAQIFRTCCLEKMFLIARTRAEGVRALGGK